MSLNPLSLQDKTAFITGGGGGIGRAITLALAEQGANISIIDSIPLRCDELVSEVEARGGRAIAFCGNVMDAEFLQNAIHSTHSTFSRLDILINNAGGVTRRDFLDLQEKNWRRHIDLNLISVLTATTTAAPYMIEGNRGGSIINVTSIEAARAAPGYAVYAACKAGVNNLTRTLAVEFAEHKIRVNAIAPDYTDTIGTRGNFFDSATQAHNTPLPIDRTEAIRRRIPLGRAGYDTECGALATFLASDMASYITGTIIPIDGGTWASSGWIRNKENQWVLPPEIT